MMDCKHCHKQLVIQADLMTYYQSPTAIHLALKPEKKTEQKNIKFVQEGKDLRVACRNCGNPAGKEVPLGPDGCRVASFGIDKIQLFGQNFCKKDKWGKVTHLHHLIEKRTHDNFFGARADPILAMPAPVRSQASSPLPKMIRCSSLIDSSKFKWDEILDSKVPRDYQLLSFIDSMLSDVILVMPTGSGKTLCSSMVLSRMSKENPSHIGLFLVNRIPLVFQQADAIRQDTGLKVIGLCSENITKLKINQIVEGRYDVLVITVGALISQMREKKSLSLEMFHTIVMDECHHAKGRSDFNALLQMLACIPLTNRPKFLGLTASPIQAKNAPSAYSEMESFLSNFPRGTRFLRPRLTKEMKTNTTEEWQYISLSDAQTMLCKNIFDFFKTCQSRLNLDFPNSWTESTESVSMCIPQIRGALRSMSQIRKMQDLEQIFTLVNALEITRIMGPRFSLPQLQRFPGSTATFSASRYSSEVSSRLLALEHLLNQVYQSPDARQKRILIFVQTRDSADILHKHLNQKYPNFRPKRVVGKGGWQGMDWDSPGGQQEALDDFNSGRSNLLVATSVLEEGLDIESCEMVIIFSQSLNLIRMIQTRGRARKANSRYIILADEAQREMQNRIKIQEQLLDFVIGPSKYGSSPKAEKIFRELEADKDLNEVKIERRSRPVVTSDVDDVGFFVFVQGSQSSDEDELMESLANRINSMHNFNVSRILPIDQDLNQTRGLFSTDCRTFLVGLKCFGTRSSPLVIYRNLCDMISQLNVGKHFKNAFIALLKQPENIAKPYTAPFLQGIQKVSLGRFQDRKSVIQSTNSILDSIQNISCSNRVIQISLSVDFENYTVNLSQVSTLGFALCTAIADDQFRICIPLSAFPVIYWISGSRQIRLFSWPSQSEVDLSLNNVLILDLKGNIAEWDRIRSCLFGPDLFPINLFDVHLEFVHKREPLPFDFDINGLEVEDDFHDLVVYQQDTASLDFDILWKINVLRSSGRLLIPETFCHTVSENLEKYGRQVVGKSLDCLNSSMTRDISFMADAVQLFENIVQDMTLITQSVEEVLADPAPKDFVTLKTLIVTPTRKIYRQEMPVMSNRLMRKFPNETFLNVSFCEETLSKLQDIKAIDIVKDIIQNGIQIFVELFHFISASGSQMREHSAIFVKAESVQHVYNLRNSILTNSDDFKSVSQYLSRVGLFSTADVPKGDVPLSAICMIRDVKAQNGVLLTDGAGKIRRSFADEELGLNVDSDVIQFRYNGAKGILLKVDDNDADLIRAGPEENIFLRPSNVKFVTGSLEFGCVNQSKNQGPVCLNREVINLLTSIASKNHLLRYDERIWELQEQALKTYGERLSSHSVAENVFSQYLPTHRISEICRNFNVLEQSWWLKLLLLTYLLDVQMLKEKANIPVEKGIRLFGAPDPNNILKEGEIFCSIENVNEPVHTLKGDVLIYRNPCLHPGDLRVVRAVQCPELSRYKNVIIFPAKANCKSSLADQCSGGDLDGDEFSVIWDYDLVPWRGMIQEPLDYSSLKQNAPNNVEDVNNQHQIAEFYGVNMKNDALGRVSHMHLALCDILPAGACDPLAIDLAQSQSIAVDFPKTGILTTVPLKAKETVDKEGFPDFMDKASKKTYVSEKLLGKLYRRVTSFIFDDTDVSIESFVIPNPDPDLIVEGHQKYLKEAKIIYKHYTYDLLCMINKFGLKHEEEFFLGRPLHWHPMLKSNKGKAMLAISNSCESLMTKYERLFCRGLDPHDRQGRLAKASAWYIISFPNTKRKFPHQVRSFLSFGWIMEGLLCEIKNCRKIEEIHNTKPLEKAVGDSILNYFTNSQTPVVQQKLSIFCPCASKLEGLIKRDRLQVFMYGSVSIFMPGESSDLDVCVWNNSGFDEMILFENVISPAIDSMVSSKNLPNSDMNNPFLRCSIPWIGANEGSGDPDTIDCDISLNKQGVMKTAYLHALYLAKPVLLPVFSFLVVWARNAAILKTDPKDSFLMPTAEFYAFILAMLSDSVPLILPRDFKRCAIEDLPDLFDHLFDHVKACQVREVIDIGRLTLDFFRKASVLSGRFTYTWPEEVSPGNRTISFDESAVKFLAGECEKALLKLTFHRSARTLLFMSSNSSLPETFTKLLSQSLSSDFENAIDFHTKRLQIVTGLIDVKLEREGSLLKLTAIGDRKNIASLKVQIRLMGNGHYLHHCGQSFNRSFRYFMHGSEILLFATGSKDSSLTMKFSEYFGESHNRHVRSPLFYPIAQDLWASFNQEGSKKLNAQYLDQKLRTQLRNIQMTKREKLLKSFSIKIRFGRFYLSDRSMRLQESSRSLTVNDLERELERGKSRKVYDRNEFQTNTENDDSESKDTRVVLHSSGPSSVLGEKINKPPERKKSKSCKISGSFMPGVCEVSGPTSVNLSEDAIEAREKVFKAVLKESGFKMVADVAKECVAKTSSVFCWKICIKASASYEIILKLDQSQKMIEMHERELTWVHASILGFGKSSNPIDVRINVQSKDKIEKTSELFREVFPTSVPHGSEVIVECHSKAGPLKFSQVMSPKSRKNIMHVRRVDRSFVFTDAETGLADATITVGTLYEGADLKVVKPYCTLSLKWNTDRLEKAIRDQGSYSDCKKLSEDLIERVYEIANRICQKMPSHH